MGKYARPKQAFFARRGIYGSHCGNSAGRGLRVRLGVFTNCRGQVPSGLRIAGYLWACTPTITLVVLKRSKHFVAPKSKILRRQGAQRSRSRQPYSGRVGGVVSAPRLDNEHGRATSGWMVVALSRMSLDQMRNLSTHSTTTDENSSLGQTGERRQDSNETINQNPSQLPRRSSRIASQVTQGSRKRRIDTEDDECPIPSQVPRLEISEPSFDMANFSQGIDLVENIRPAISDDYFGVTDIPCIDKITHEVVKISQRPNSTYDKLQWIGSTRLYAELIKSIRPFCRQRLRKQSLFDKKKEGKLNKRVGRFKKVNSLFDKNPSEALRLIEGKPKPSGFANPIKAKEFYKDLYQDIAKPDLPKNLDEKIDIGSFKGFSEEEVKAAVMKLNNKTAPGLDKVNASDLKDHFRANPKILTAFFNLLFFCRNIPNKLKEARIKLIPKIPEAGEDLSKYRPIAVTSVIYRAFLSLVNTRLSETLKKYLPKSQRAYVGGTDGVALSNQLIHMTLRRFVISCSQSRKSTNFLSIRHLGDAK